MSDTIWADQVRRGDVIVWCDRLVTVDNVTRDSGGSQRRGRYFFGEVDGVQRRLHYFDSEKVVRYDELLPPVSSSQENPDA